MKRMRKLTTLSLVMLVALIMAGSQLARAAVPFSGTVNINTASLEQLVELPGIGPAKAQAIVEYRTNVPFKTVDEIKMVKGIGDKMFAKLAPHLTVNGETKLSTQDKQPGGGAKAKK